MKTETETKAYELIQSVKRGHGWGDWHYVEEELLRDRDGHLFLHGHGGCASLWRAWSAANRGWVEGERTVRLSPAAATAWLQTHDTWAALESAGELPEDDD